MDWRRIETAPKDGTRILLWFDECPAVAEWVEIEGEGFWMPSENLISDVVGAYESSHWMPLPPPPADA